MRDPATGKVIAEVADLGLAETNQAIAAAAEAGSGWRGLPASQRSARLRRWCELLLLNQDDLALLITAEQGKPLTEFMAEVASAAGFVEWYAEEAKR